ncbi:MAG: Holliday junction resolvase Hjc [Acidilobaceae archaeon]
MAKIKKPKAKGSRAENELAIILWNLGYAVIRGPSSGGGVRRRFQPDIVAIKNGHILIFEVKTGREGEPIYVEASQVIGIQEFARRSNGKAYIAVRLAGGEWRIHNIDMLSITKGGNYKLEAPEKGLKIRDLDETLFPKDKKITSYL